MAKSAPAKGATKDKEVLPPASPAPVEYLKLDELLLDVDNARLGARASTIKKQELLLDEIVEQFGVDDILSSLAVNGFFPAEPLVGYRQVHDETKTEKEKRSDGKEESSEKAKTQNETQSNPKVVIAEGNRRLAACLILAGDPRARSHKKRRERFLEIQRKHGVANIERLPVRVLEKNRSLTSYLGVRHIAQAQAWDSYAKARWIDTMLTSGDLSLDELAEMIGDQHRTVSRMLQGYRFVTQLIDAAQFSPDQSMKKGKGSNKEFPFSWVYTAIQFASIREWLSLNEDDEAARPIPAEKLPEAGSLMKMLVGCDSATETINPAISDSRQIKDLARAIATPQMRTALLRGKTVESVLLSARPAAQRIADSLLDAEEALKLVIEPFNTGEMKPDDCSSLVDPVQRVLNLAKVASKKING